MKEKYAVIEISGGIGKNVIALTVINSIKLKYPDRNVIVITAYPEVYLNNPSIYRVFKYGYCPYFYNDYVKNKDVLFFCAEPYRSNGYIKQECHLIESWCNELQIPTQNTLGKLYITPREIIDFQSKVKTEKPILLFQPFGGANTKLKYSWNRDIPPHQAQTLVDILKEKYNIIQIGLQGQTKLNGCETVNLPLRELFVLVTMSAKILAIDSCIQHIAAVLNKPSTVCWVTNKPNVFGYPIHKNILPRKEIYNHSDYQAIDGYFGEYDFSGSRNHDFPFNTPDIFEISDIVESILK